MKNIHFLLLLSSIFYPIASIHAQWQVIDPKLPDSLNLVSYGISVVDENVVWGNPTRIFTTQMSPDRYFYKTTDGGQTWTFGEIEAATGGNWWTNYLYALDSTIAWVARVEGGAADMGGQDSSEVLKTTDGGNTWVRQDLPYTLPTNLAGIHFFNANEGAAWGEARTGSMGFYPTSWKIVCFYTQDGGNTWYPATTPESEDEGFIWASATTSMGSEAIVGDNIWFGTSKSRVIFSNDRGKTWNFSAPLHPGRPIDVVAFRDALHGMAFSAVDLSFNTQVPKLAFHTTDGGKTWTPLPPANTNWPGWLTDVEYVPGSGGVYWGVSQSTSVLSKDNGTTWVHEYIPYLLWYAKFLSPSIGWGAGIGQPGPGTPKCLMYKWVGGSLLRDETINSTTTLCGSGLEGYVDGSPEIARFLNPKGMAMDHQGNVYVADDYNNCIRKINADGQVSTLAGTGLPGYANGPGALAQFNRPQDVVLDTAGNLYVGDTYNYVVRKIAPDGTVSLFAGKPGVIGKTDGTALQATFDYPAALAIDGAGNIYVGGLQTVRKISTSGMVSSIYNAQGVVWGLDADRAGTVYFGNFTTQSVHKLTPSGQHTVLAGGGAGCVDGTGTTAKFGSVEDLAVDDFGNIYVADGRNARIRKIDDSGNVVTLLGSDCLNGYSLDQFPVNGPASLAQLGRVRGLLLKPDGNLLVTAWDDDMVREVRLGALPTAPYSVLGASLGVPYNSMPVSQAQALFFSGTLANTGSAAALGRMRVSVLRDGAGVYQKTTALKNIPAGSQVSFDSGDSVLFSTPGTYEIFISFLGLSNATVLGTWAEEFVVSDSVLAADDGWAYYYDQVQNSTFSFGQAYELPVPDTLTGFSMNTRMTNAAFCFSVYAMDGDVPGALIYTSDTVLDVSTAFPYWYYHRLPQSLALPGSKYLFAITKLDPNGVLALGTDTDHNDQSAWYRSPEYGVPDWTPVHDDRWGEQTGPVYMLRPVFGTPVMTITDTWEPAVGNLTVKVAPNPVSDHLFVILEAEPAETFTIRLFDMNGKLVRQTTANGSSSISIEMAEFPAGMYQLRVLGAGRTAVCKVLKK